MHRSARPTYSNWCVATITVAMRRTHRNGCNISASVERRERTRRARRSSPPRQALAAYGRIDVLVNNVGGTIWIKPYHLYTEEEVKLELERSLYPTLWCCLAVLPIMMTQRSGSIVNLGSQSPRGLYRLPYAASKGGILALSKVLAMEYGRYGIRINTMAPGGTEITDRVTPRQYIEPGVMADEGDEAEAERYRREMAEDIRNQQALQRRGLPEEQAAAIAFLASDDASFITGQVINCSGGQS